MPLAAIVGLCTFLIAPGGSLAHPPAVFQETQPQQEAPPPSPTQEQPKPAGPETKPDQSAPPPEPPPPASPQPSPQPDSTAKPSAKAAPTAATKPRKKRKHKTAAKPSSGPTRTVVRNGSTADPIVQLSPGMSQQQTDHANQNIGQLLSATDANLKKISGRSLNASQQDMRNQIQKYVEQAKTAEDAGDLQRARNLAVKARLLSDELLRR